LAFSQISFPRFNLQPLAQPLTHSVNSVNSV